ncbi:MAG: ADP-ribosylglycohydrolase family protein, partial [Actinomycetota bacterium]
DQRESAAAGWRQVEAGDLDGVALIEVVREHTPDGETRDGIGRAARLGLEAPVDEAARALGTGQRVSAQDTVPFVIWCAARCLAGSFEEAFWTTLRGMGDRDTTCAMVGGIVALTCREIPDAWLAAREPLPEGFSL